jgi:maleamate amidohydrolase
MYMTDKQAVYQQAGYGQKQVGFGEKPALLLVDFQQAFTNEEYPTGKNPFIKQAASETAELLALAREKDIPVIYTVVGYRDDKWDTGNWKTDIGWITIGSHAMEVSAEVEPIAGEPVVLKKYPSAFFGTEVLSLLTTKQVDTVIVTGCTTSGCVRATIIDAFSYGFKTIVPEECVGDQAKESHDANLFDVNARYADVLPKERVVEYLGALKASPITT